MVVLSVFAVLASIFLPYLERTREADRRVRCYDNLMHLSAALRDYAAESNHCYPATAGDPRRPGYACFTDPVRPNDVTASLWLLVRRDLARPRDFICPSTDDVAEGDASTGLNFRSPAALSYSYACPFSSDPRYRLNDTRPPEFALIADRNPGPPAAAARVDAGPLELSAGNSPNHGRSGQNVLYADGHADFCSTPYSGCNGDNIYSAQSRRPRPGAAPLACTGVVAADVGPACESDSYLVPTAADVVGAAALAPGWQPSTVPDRTPPAVPRR
jgi:prepilin-type processing-associated H-X9-DG protein